MNKQYMQNREKFAELMKDNSQAIIFSGTPRLRAGDELYPFWPQRNFYYLTGISKPNLIVAIVKRDGKASTTLFLERFDELNAKWIGAVLCKDEAEKISGIDKFKYIDEFNSFVQGLAGRSPESTFYIDAEKVFWGTDSTEDLKFAAKLRKKHPLCKIENCHKLLAQLRQIKNDGEIENIKKAINITNDSFAAIITNAKPGMYEYELEAYHDYTIRKNGAGKAFATIAAAGKNAAVLHYVDNNTRTEPDDLVLLDFGASWNGYSADISRTFPVNGKFTDRQKLLYNIVLEANMKVIAAVKPGLPYKRLNEIVIEHYGVELKKIGLIQDASEVSKYYYHGVSHPLGLETHDVFYADGERLLQEGMVFTVEPGLYIEQEGIGIRIEDDVLITSNGCDVLSKDIVKTAEDIEKLMKH